MEAKFIITGVPRSGTTFLVNSLNKLDRASVFGEICSMRGGKLNKKIHWQKEVQEQRAIKEENSYRSWLIRYAKVPEQPDVRKFHTNELLFKFLDHTFASNNIVGFKLLANHIDRLPATVDYIKARNIKVIHLVRKNILKTVLSGKVRKDVPFEKFKLDYGDIARKATDIQLADIKLEKLFSGKNYLKLFYEDITEDKEICVIPHKIGELVFNFLGLSGNGNLGVFVKRTSPDKISQRITNFKDFKEFVEEVMPEYLHMVD